MQKLLCLLGPLISWDYLRMFKKILINSAVFGFSQHIPKVVGVFILPILTKYLTDVDFGIAGTIAAYTGAIAVFSTLGLNIVLTNSF